MFRNAVTCDRPDCLALFIEPDANPYARPGFDTEPTRAEDVLDFDQLVDLAGWVTTLKVLVRPDLPDTDVTGHICPACVGGGGPVFELGECPRCGGRTTDLPAGARCQYCHGITPHPTDDDLEAMNAAYEEVDAAEYEAFNQEMDARDATQAARAVEGWDAEWAKNNPS